MEIYINGTGCISPQKTFDEAEFSLRSLQTTEAARLNRMAPDYQAYINPALLRRMSGMIKMGITAATICLRNADVKTPGAIITGTGLGCIEDTEKFTFSILGNNEQLLSPTPFIQSTHNTVGGQIALLLGCHEYNYTYVHRGNSFESSLLDAMMMIGEQTADNILVGGIDELTDNSYKILQQLGIYSREETVGPALSSGTAGGEGASFFLLSKEKTDWSKAKVSFLKMYSGKNDPETALEKIRAALAEAGKKPEEISLVLTGESGHKKFDAFYKILRSTIFSLQELQTFKQYCGEYPTASAFACWLAVKKINEENYPSVLICNDFGGADLSLILIEKC